MSMSHRLSSCVHPKGRAIVVGAFAVVLVATLLSSTIACFVLPVALYALFSFRDPQRAVPVSPGMVLALSDGIVMDVASAPLPEILGVEGEENYQCITMDTRPHYARVNRMPVAGKVLREMYTPAKGITLTLNKSSEDTEQELVAIQTEKEEVIAFSQRGFLIPGQVMASFYEGDTVEQGQRCGIMRCGGQTKVYVPSSYKLMVAKGTSVIAGETMLAVDARVFKPGKLEWALS